ncbi:hypothetical protein [Methylopila sp. M107]|uniref:hypothetical protein n=1 Tax=Methylopila sp. M107 TaxID=1101190 RepID=UPI0012DE7B5E|nr:hypothetical protein [Methylopila sp. M107]
MGRFTPPQKPSDHRARLARDSDHPVTEPIRGNLLAVLATLGPIAEELPDVDLGLLPPDDVDL